MELFSKLGRDKNSHKGQNGKVAVVGGSKDFTGAPAISAKASLRTGADLVKILTSETVKDVVAGYSENFIVRPYSGDYLGENSIDKALKTLKWSDSAVIGPGLGDDDPRAVENIVGKTDTPLVIDAEAIKPSLDADISDAVFTPHEAEKEVIEQKFGSVEQFVEEKDVVVVLKGRKDRIFTPGEVFENKTGDPAMTVGGTGDSLAGVIASLIAQGMSLKESGRLGAYINAKAGEKAAEEYGNGALATDIVEEISGIFPK